MAAVGQSGLSVHRWLGETAHEEKGAVMAIDPAHDPHARIVTRPLPSQVRKAVGKDALPKAVPVTSDPFLRPENEDDDGYDPYSDRPAPQEPLFQEDPWS